MNFIRFFAVAIALGTVSVAMAEVTWMNDLEAAKARAAKEHKAMVLEFTGSAWCPPCKALHAAVLTSPEFAAFSKDVVLVALDYPTLSERAPEKVRANPALTRLMAIKEKYQVPGFPTVFYFDANGKQQSKLVGYGGDTPPVFLAKLTGATPAQ
jgi:thiol:disulfide interchange protein